MKDPISSMTRRPSERGLSNPGDNIRSGKLCAARGKESKRWLIRQPELFISLFLMCGCQQTGNAPKLQGHLQGARTASDRTSEHLGKTKNSIERIDFKSGKALEVLDKGFEK